MTCPPSRPVRCPDASCAHSNKECNAVQGVTLTSVPCPDQGWASQVSNCGVGVTCPPLTPVKCWDNSCRVVPEDCPTALQPLLNQDGTVEPIRKCPIEMPFLCSSGDC